MKVFAAELMSRGAVVPNRTTVMLIKTGRIGGPIIRFYYEIVCT